MENSVFITIAKSKKSIAIALLSFILFALSGFIVIKISLWNKAQARIILSWVQEREAKQIWQQIAQYGPPPGQMIGNSNYMASFSVGIDEFVAIALTDFNGLASKYIRKNNNFDFSTLDDLLDSDTKNQTRSLDNGIAVVKLLVGNELNRRRRGRWGKSSHKNKNMGKHKIMHNCEFKRYAIIVFREGNRDFITPFVHQMYLWPAVWLLGTLLWFSLLFYQIKLANVQTARQQESHFLATGRMSARLAHEIKNPLGAIRGIAQHLQSQKDNSDANNIMLNTIEKETIRLEQLTKNILEFSKPHKAHIIQVNIIPLIKDIVEIFKLSSPKTKVVLTLPDNEVNVSGDIDAIRQILLNLLKNGSEASEDPEIEVNLSINSKNITINVIDNGTGIPQKIADDIFAPFFSTKNNGYGLGLAICQKLAHTNSGKLEIINNEKKGVTAKLTLVKEKTL